MVQLAFDATQVAPQESFDPIPAGTYNVIIEDTEMRDTRSGTGQYLLITMSVLDGPHAGRKLWDRLNLINPNPTAVEIANRQLSAICHAVGRPQIADSVDLHNKPLAVKVKISQREGYDPSNEVSGYKQAAGGTSPAVAAAPAAAPAATAAPSNGSVPPWQR